MKLLRRLRGSGELGDPAGSGREASRATKKHVARLVEQATSWDASAEAAQRELVELGDEAVAAVASALPTSSKPFVLRNVLVAIGGSSVVDSFIALLADPASDDVGKAAAAALGELGDRRAVEPLIALLRPGISNDLRCAAADALGELGDGRAVEPLVRVLGEDVWFRYAVGRALGKLGDPAAIPALVAALAGGRAHDEIFAALAELGWEPSSPDERIAMSLTREDWDALADEGAAGRQAFTDWLRDQLPKGPNTMPQDRSLLEALLTDVDPRMRRHATDGLGQVDDSWAVELLGAVLEDPDDDVRRAAVRALRAKSGDDVIRLLRMAAGDRSRYVRADAGGELRSRGIDPGGSEAVVDTSGMSSGEMVGVLRRLCAAYATDDEKLVDELEPVATQIGEELDRQGGIDEMRRVFALLENVRGTRVLDMHWGGIGDWRG